jgi:hypothetical protein
MQAFFTFYPFLNLILPALRMAQPLRKVLSTKGNVQPSNVHVITATNNFPQL